MGDPRVSLSIGLVASHTPAPPCSASAVLCIFVLDSSVLYSASSVSSVYLDASHIWVWLVWLVWLAPPGPVLVCCTASASAHPPRTMRPAPCIALASLPFALPPLFFPSNLVSTIHRPTSVRTILITDVSLDRRPLFLLFSSTSLRSRSLLHAAFTSLPPASFTLIQPDSIRDRQHHNHTASATATDRFTPFSLLSNQNSTLTGLQDNQSANMRYTMKTLVLATLAVGQAFAASIGNTHSAFHNHARRHDHVE